MANHRTDTKGATVKVTLVKSPTGFNGKQGIVVRSLGLQRIRHSVELKDTPETRGMIHKVRHLVEVEVIRLTEDMDLNNLRPPKGMKHAKKRIGRGQGSGNGKTAGRGHKGAKSRSGYKFKRGFEGGQMPLHRRVPKRGFHNPFRVEYEVVNLDTLGERFDAGTVITIDLLAEHRLVSSKKALLKVLGRGEIGKALTVRAHKFSGKAAEKIAAAGGATEQLA